MKTETILYGISAIAILAGIWTLYYSLKKWNPEYKPRKVLAKLIRELLGSKGSQIFSGIMGTLLIIFGIGITYLTLTKDTRSKNKSYAKSEFIRITEFDAQYGAVLNSKQKIEKQKISRMGKEHLKNYQTVSFKNNGIDEIPDFVWEMSNLEILDLTNNELTDIPSDINKLVNLKSLILNGNPVKLEQVENLKK